jgi:hypothetical protein
VLIAIGDDQCTEQIGERLIFCQIGRQIPITCEMFLSQFFKPRGGKQIP